MRWKTTDRSTLAGVLSCGRVPQASQRNFKGYECLTQLEPERDTWLGQVLAYSQCVNSFVPPLGTVTEVTALDQTMQGSTVKYDDLAVPSSHPHWEGDS